MEKVYIARVQGIFPPGKVSATAGLVWDPKLNHVTAYAEGFARDASGREAKASCTEFKRLAVAPDNRTSLVKCW